MGRSPMDRSSSISWKPDPALDLPMYRQIEAYIRQKITTGEWSAGYRLPSQRTLAAAMGVNRSTLVTALDNLAATGMIEGRHGVGPMSPVLAGTALLIHHCPIGVKLHRRAGITRICQRYSRLIRPNSVLALFGWALASLHLS